MKLRHSAAILMPEWFLRIIKALKHNGAKIVPADCKVARQKLVLTMGTSLCAIQHRVVTELTTLGSSIPRPRAQALWSPSLYRAWQVLSYPPQHP